nr:aldehyde dehydrogenase family protein [Gammaproteobacteria bacterium]
MSVTTYNPATGKAIQTYKEMPWNEVNKIIAASQDDFLAWQSVEMDKRRELMLGLAKLLTERRDEYAKIITTEMGKIFSQAQGEITKCAWLAEHYANTTESYLQPKSIKTEMHKSYICYQPLGVIYAIMPWNFPFWQVLRFAVPNLMAGNAGILKHAPISTGAALALEKLFQDAGFPKNLFRSVIVDNDVAGKIIDDKRIAGVTLTGSDVTGRIIGSRASKNLKKVVLELGGSDPYLILADADLELAAETCVNSRLSASGQICISPKRLIVVSEIFDEFSKLVLEKAQTFKHGDPMNPESKLGPIAREDLRKMVHEQVQQSIKNGAQC